MEKRIFYNTENGKAFIFSGPHVEFFHNHKADFQGNFDEYLRAIYSENILYIRVYYPYNDIGELSYNDLMSKSRALIDIYKADLIKALVKQGLTIDKAVLNVTNGDLKGLLNTPFV